MKIIQKKCPNCGASLDFRYGEHDAECIFCHSKFALEYDESKVEIKPYKYARFGVTTAEAEEAVEQFCKLMRRAPYARPGDKAVLLKIDIRAFQELFVRRGVTQRILMSIFPTMRVMRDEATCEICFLLLEEK